MDINSHIKKDNIMRYYKGDEVNKYMNEDYHTERINLAITILNNEFSEKDRSNTKVLDIASGNGLISKKLKNLGYRVICSDLTVEQLESISFDEIEIVKLDVSEKFDFGNETFDAIIAGDIIEHLYDIELFFTECNRILKKGGYLIITTPNLAALQDRINFLFGISPKQIQPCHIYYKLHIRPFTLKLLCETYESFGFNILSKKSNYVTWKHKNKHIIYSKLLANFFPSIGRSLIVCGKKI